MELGAWARPFSCFGRCCEGPIASWDAAGPFPCPKASLSSTAEHEHAPRRMEDRMTEAGALVPYPLVLTRKGK